ncbi:MAG: DNA translocase FtsK [Herpetosiphonaceae bacterium]|nr:DNA translocase FtsK [Herpetosiphonaceae bacterium]
MSTRNSNTKNDGPPSKRARSAAPKSGGKGTPARRTPSRKAAPPRPPLLTPQRQREFFALLLLGLGALLLAFLLSNSGSDAGSIGTLMANGMRNAFGLGALVVPVMFIVVGVLILWQERYIEAPITGGNLLGVIVLALLALAMLETKNINELAVRDPGDGHGGGVLGLLINRALVSAFGAPGTWTLLLLLFVLAVLLTFNITLRQAFSGIKHGWTTIKERIVGSGSGGSHDDLAPEPVPFSEELKRHLPQLKNVGKRPAPPLPAPRTPAQELQEQLIFTPIAARPTQASLWEGRHGPATASQPGERVKPTEAQTEQVALAKTGAASAAATGKTVPLSGDVPAKKGKAGPPPEEDGIAEIETGGPHQAWPLPGVELYDDYVESEVDDNEKRSKARVIEYTLSSFKIEAQVVGMNPGPAVTQYQLQPATGVKVSRITSLERDLALALSAPSIRIEAPIPGTPYIGIEIPNSAIASVSMKEVIDTDEFRLHKGKLKLALGKDVSGSPVVTDLAKAPHLLIAGSTGSGKSIAINSIVATLLQEHTPDELRFIMIDPKMVELIVYNHIPHLLAPVVTELERVVSLLKWSVREMERRYKLLAQKGFRNIESFNKEARKRPDLEALPYIVIIIDELADLMMLAPDEVETLICRLAQMARAIGIHLILATQRPSVDVVTGLIKANFPTRMAFAVTSQIDSRVILDTNGAEQLLGRGDMLYLASDAPKPIRVQGTFVSDREVEKLVTFWRAAQKPDQVMPGTEGRVAPKPVPMKPRVEGDWNGDGVSSGSVVPASTERTEMVGGVSALPNGMGDVLDPAEQDELLPKAIQLVRQHERASASLLQRRLRIGYSKAAQLIDLLEQQGIVGPAEGGRSREVLQDGE